MSYRGWRMVVDWFAWYGAHEQMWTNQDGSRGFVTHLGTEAAHRQIDRIEDEQGQGT